MQADQKDHFAQMGKFLANCRTHRNFRTTDIIITVGDQTERMHSTVGCMYSDLIRQLVLENDSPLAKPMTVDLTGCSFEAVSKVIDWMYFGAIDKHVGNVDAHLEVTRRLHIPGLRRTLDFSCFHSIPKLTDALDPQSPSDSQSRNLSHVLPGPAFAGGDMQISPNYSPTSRVRGNHPELSDSQMFFDSDVHDSVHRSASQGDQFRPSASRKASRLPGTLLHKDPWLPLKFSEDRFNQNQGGELHPACGMSLTQGVESSVSRINIHEYDWEAVNALLDRYDAVYHPQGQYLPPI